MRRLLWWSLWLVILAACSKEPRTFEELKNAGQKAFVEERYADARKYLAQAVALKSSDRDALYFLGISYQRDYLYDSALVFLKRADLLHPRDRQINLELYKVCLAMQDWRNATRAISVLASTGDNIENYYAQLVELNFKLENYPVAYLYLRKLHEKEPEVADHYLKLANMAKLLDSNDVAIAMIDSAIARFGQKDELTLNKGMYLSAKREFASAEALFRILVAKDSASVPYRINLAHALASQKEAAKKTEALKLYEALVPVVNDTIFKLDSLIGVLKEELRTK
jgi:tetratricopeptide (TPR) repeat protein